MCEHILLISSSHGVGGPKQRPAVCVSRVVGVLMAFLAVCCDYLRWTSNIIVENCISKSLFFFSSTLSGRITVERKRMHCKDMVRRQMNVLKNKNVSITS